MMVAEQVGRIELLSPESGRLGKADSGGEMAGVQRRTSSGVSLHDTVASVGYTIFYPCRQKPKSWETLDKGLHK